MNQQITHRRAVHFRGVAVAQQHLRRWWLKRLRALGREGLIRGGLCACDLTRQCSHHAASLAWINSYFAAQIQKSHRGRLHGPARVAVTQ
jgi:hypothetical protein